VGNLRVREDIKHIKIHTKIKHNTRKQLKVDHGSVSRVETTKTADYGASVAA